MHHPRSLRWVGSIVSIVLCLGTAQRDAAAAEDKRTNRIKVLEATYGGNCTGVAAGNVTTFVASACQRPGPLQLPCVLQGRRRRDAAAGCDKEFRVSYSCGKSTKRETCALEAEAGKGGEDGYPNRFCLLHCLTTGTQERSRSKIRREAAPQSGSAPRAAAPAPHTAAPAPRAAPAPQTFVPPPFDGGFRTGY